MLAVLEDVETEQAGHTSQAVPCHVLKQACMFPVFKYIKKEIYIYIYLPHTIEICLHRSIYTYAYTVFVSGVNMG